MIEGDVPDSISRQAVLPAAAEGARPAEETAAVTGAGVNVDRFTPEEFNALVQLIQTRSCILFLGAGAHFPPPDDSRFSYPKTQRPPLAGDLAEALAKECGFSETCPGESDRNLQRVAMCYEHKHSRRKLIDEIRLAVDGSTEPSPVIRGLAELPFPLVMTTNYDRLFERALSQVKPTKRPDVEVYSPERHRAPRDYPRATAERPFLFKMHGDVSDSDSIVVTDEDYITFVLRMNEMEGVHPIPKTMGYRLWVDATLFVGYGLLDFNLRLLFRAMRWTTDSDASRPETYSVDTHPDPLVSDEWKRKHGLRFIIEDVWSFVPRLYKAVLGDEMPA